MTVAFNTMAADNVTYAARRLRLDKIAQTRPGTGFKTTFPQARGAFVIPESAMSAQVTWS